MTNLYFLFFFSLFFSLKPYFSFSTTDSISLTSSLRSNQTLISKQEKFELGFFKPSQSSNNYYIGVWYKNLPGQTVVWVANRVEPITDPHSSQLKISNDGNLVLLNSSNHQIWSTNTASKVTHATLSDTSNLILKNGSGSIVWESFDHPGNTLMPGARFGYNKITRQYTDITCWESPDNPAPGPFTMRFDPDGSNQYIMWWNGSEIYWWSGLWTGTYFMQLPNVAFSNRLKIKLTFTDTYDGKYAKYTLTENSIIARIILNSDGQYQMSHWLNNIQGWQPYYIQPVSQCDVYSVCGPYGICDTTKTIPCSCIKGFEPLHEKDWESNDFNTGCVRKTKLQCGERNDAKKIGFLKMGNVSLPANPLRLPILGEKACESACLKNCSCVAHSYNSGCLIWTKEIRNLKQFYGDGNNGSVDLYIRMAASDIPNSSYSHKILIRVVIWIVVWLIIILFSIFSVIFYRNKWRRRTIRNKIIKNSLIMFSYSDLQILTKNFSERLGGGGFGSVFKGWLPDQTEVAVKKLEGSNQGEKQFQTEVSTLAGIQHINLIKLRGFCSKTNKRLVVYEYMSGGSLDSLLFKEKRTYLSWKMRYQIILGIARGVAYLHEECRGRIIHCDIKPDNILLDSNYCAKIADFGMAKLIGRDFSRVLTTTRGTIGYLAPEWFTGQPITIKVDVYSFGMMLFEIISGKRNTRNFEDNVMGYFPYWAARRIVEDNISGLLDERLQGMECDMIELKRVCRIACWCIQDSEFHRPNMSQVVKGLEGVVEVNIPMIPRVLEPYLMQEKMLSVNSSLSFGDREISEE